MPARLKWKRMDGPSGEAQWGLDGRSRDLRRGSRSGDARTGHVGHDIAKELGVGKSTIYRILRELETQVSQCPKGRLLENGTITQIGA